MAVLLKRTGERTIQGEIKRYVITNGYYLFAFVFCCVLMITIVYYRYFNENRQQAALNAFYESVDEMDDYFYSYAISLSQPEYENCVRHSGQIKISFDAVKDLLKDTVYQRESRDIGHMLEQVYDNLETVRNRFEEPGIRTLAYRLYEENYEILEIIKRTYQNMYRRFLFLSGLRFKRLAAQIVLFFLLYFLFFFIEFVIWIRRADHLAGSLAAPIQKFTGHIRENGEKGYRCIVPIQEDAHTYEELKIWEHVYNEMISMILQHQQEQEEAYKNKMELQERTMENLRISKKLETLRYKTLQAQINPHFLFNTMNMMMQSAYLHQDMETAELLENTSDLLRYGLDYLNTAVTLQEELEALDHYLCIQEKRFGNRIKFVLELDESFHGIRIPNLILQPLVENSITHGLRSQTGQGIVRIQTKRDREKGQGILSVSDNGAGMSRERVAEVLEGIYEEEEHETAIGLHNVYQRLNIFFGGNVMLEIESAEKKGTEIRIKIPLEIG